MLHFACMVQGTLMALSDTCSPRASSLLESPSVPKATVWHQRATCGCRPPYPKAAREFPGLPLMAYFHPRLGWTRPCQAFFGNRPFSVLQRPPCLPWDCKMYVGPEGADSCQQGHLTNTCRALSTSAGCSTPGCWKGFSGEEKQGGTEN